jgi:hypothetical protein
METNGVLIQKDTCRKPTRAGNSFKKNETESSNTLETMQTISVSSPLVPQ